MTCRCLITIRGQTRCQHASHPNYKLPVIEATDCVGCPLKIETDEQGQPLLPGKMAQAKHLAKDMAAAAADGFIFVSKRCVDERELVCLSCPMLIVGRDKCAACGCSLKAKRRLRAWTCDLGYWDHVPVDIQPHAPLPEASNKPGDLAREG